MKVCIEAEKQWDFFFDEIVKEIGKNTVNRVVNNFICDFSTTTSVHKVISTSILMNSVQKFFKFEREIGLGCGINNVYMAGTR